MITLLNEIEARVLGALIEKQIVTPDYYPMTLNGLTNACNQKTSRDPVTSFDENTVQKALDALRDKKLAYIFHGAESRVAKYGHIFDKSHGLENSETALMCVLMLRGPQTPGELRSRTNALHNFSDLGEIEEALDSLAARGEDSLVIRLPRQAGAQQSRYMQLLCGKPDVETMETIAAQVSAPRGVSAVSNDRVAKLEEDVKLLREQIADLGRQFADFRKQFE
ncbi:MAG: YceH family protein [Blastocatellia bacterium]